MAKSSKQVSKPKKYNVWRSYSDMMAGLLMLFVLIMCVTLFQAQQSYVATIKEQEEKLIIEQEYNNALIQQQQEIIDQATTIRSQDELLSELQAQLDNKNMTLEELQTTLEQQSLLLDQKTISLSEKEMELNAKSLELQGSQEKIDKIFGVKADVVEALKKEFEKNDTEVAIDPETGAMVLSSNVMFGYNENILTEEGRDVLGEVLPVYCKVLLDEKYLPSVAEIIIDGYTDTDGSYEYNLELSQKRSLVVANHLLSIASEFLEEEDVEELKKKLTVNGHSMNNPILDEKGEVDKDKSRRVEVKFRLKDEEMLRELSDILSE